MTKERTYQSTWRSSKAEAKYRELEAAEWHRLTDTPPDAHDVPTRFGTTRAYNWRGPGPAIVFLHGMSDTSVRWIPFADRLRDFDVWAFDIMGDVGASTHEVGFTSAADYPVWLEETITGLGLATPHVVGHSLGGYLALAYAMGEGRVASTVAFDPVGIVKLKLVNFMAWGFGNMAASKAPTPMRSWLAERRRFPLIADRDAMKLLAHANINHPPATPPLPVFTDAELGSIQDPLVVVAGGKSRPFDTNRMVERVRDLPPNADAILIPDAGHAVTHTHFEECLAGLRTALGSPSTMEHDKQ